jgi:hypothetical protein
MFRALAQKDANEVAAANTAFIERLDAHLTSLVRRRGATH